MYNHTTKLQIPHSNCAHKLAMPLWREIRQKEGKKTRRERHTNLTYGHTYTNNTI